MKTIPVEINDERVYLPVPTTINRVMRVAYKLLLITPGIVAIGVMTQTTEPLAWYGAATLLPLPALWWVERATRRSSFRS